MKYIRTKDGIYEVKATPETNELYAGSNTICVYDSRELVRKDICCDEVIKQADTIEELCDEFVMVTKYNHFQIKKGSWLGDFFNPNYNYISYSNDIGPDSKEKIIGKYGSIWTKGEHDEPILKSVAKMKGVLPSGEIDWELL